METILELLYEAELGNSMESLRQDPGYAGAARRRLDLLKQLTADLTPEQNALLKTYGEAENMVADMVAFRKFAYGFQLGILLAEVIAESREMPFS